MGASEPTGFVRAVPHLIVRRLDENIRFFREQLGFAVASHDPNVRFGLVCRDGAYVNLREAVSATEIPKNAGYAAGTWPGDTNPADVTVIVSDVNAVFRELTARQARPAPMEDRGYGRDTSVTLPDGHVMVFLQFE